MLTEEEKRIVVNLAMQIEIGSISPIQVIKAFAANKKAAQDICDFWLQFNDMTRNVLHMLIVAKVGCLSTEDQKTYIENCYQL